MRFFPQIMEGPISRYSDVADTLFAEKPLEVQNLQNGYIRILWGFFKKKIVADRLAIAVGMVFDHYTSYSGAVSSGISCSLYCAALYGIFGVHGYNYRKRRAFRSPASGEFPSAVLREKCGGVLEKMAHYTWGVWFKNIYFLSGFHVRNCKEMESVRAENIWGNT